MELSSDSRSPIGSTIVGETESQVRSIYLSRPSQARFVVAKPMARG